MCCHLEADTPFTSISMANMTQHNNNHESSHGSPFSAQTQHNPSPGLQRTPVAGVSGIPSRSSSQGMFGQVVSDLADRSASNENRGSQQNVRVCDSLTGLVFSLTFSRPPRTPWGILLQAKRSLREAIT